MKGPITVSFAYVLLSLGIILGPIFFIKHWSDDLWEERPIEAKNLFRENQNATTNDVWQRIAHTKEILKCGPGAACSPSSSPVRQPSFHGTGNGSAASCPLYFNWIRQDMKPWAKTGITLDMVEAAKSSASFRLTIVDGKMYVELYRKSFQTRDLFTFWGIDQLLKYYPRMVPDLDLMFNCGDTPVIGRVGHKDPAKPPPAMFHYCGSEDAFDIVFPDWSFWGWPEIMTPPWEPLVKDIQIGSQKIKWEDRDPSAYWKSNPYTGWRQELLKCNDRSHWNCHIYDQDWGREASQGFQGSKLAEQCDHRFKIFMEGNAWSVSLKNILACDSTTLLITPKYYDFFLRGLVPRKHYWPVKAEKLCDSIDFAVKWGNKHQKEAKETGKAAREFILNELKMSNVYDYMFHVLNEYAKLLKYKPTVPEKASEYCSATLFCFANKVEEQYMQESMVTTASSTPPCKLGNPEYEEKYVQEFLQKKAKTIATVKQLEESAKRR
eukprot:PITA_09983